MTALPARWTPTSSWRAPLFKCTFAGALVALALAATYASSADAFSDFDRRTIAALGGTVTTALLLSALVTRTVAALLSALVTRTVAALLRLTTRTIAVLLRLTTRTIAVLPPLVGRIAAIALALITLAGVTFAGALAVTYSSPAEALSVFHSGTVAAAFDNTVDAALLASALLLLTTTCRRAVNLMLNANALLTPTTLTGVGRIAAIALALTTLAGVTFAGALAVTYSSSAEALSVFDSGTVATAFDNTVDAALLASALLLLTTTCRRAANLLLNANVLLAVTTLAGVTTAYLVHTDFWTTAPAVVIALCAAAGFALFVAFGAIDDRPRAGAALSAAAFVGLAAVIVGRAEPRVEPVSGDVSNIRDVSLSKTPNLYFISFDALVPQTLLKRYLDVETTGFHALFDARFRRFPNLFANGVPTKNSLHAVLALDPRVHNSQAAVLGDPHTFSGQHPSPLLGILRGSGYETSTLFHNTYFGRRKGPWVDNYIYFQDRTLCNLLDEAIRPWAFWGYCRWFRHEGSPFPPAIERITSVDADSRPQFMMAHLLLPAHTGSSFRHDDAAAFERYRARYLRNLNRAADHLDLIVRHVEKDPDAILLVYSDHGMWLSRGMELDDDPEFFIQDRYGVLGGVFPPDACAPWFDAAAAPGWMTLLDAVHAVLSCLSDGRGALVEPRSWVIDPSGSPAIRPPSGDRRSARYADFDDFLYE